MNEIVKNDKLIKSVNLQGYKADGLTKNDKFIKSVNLQSCKADGLTK